MRTQATVAPGAPSTLPPPAQGTATTVGQPAPPAAADPALVYRALGERLDVLRNIRSQLENEREDIVEQLRTAPGDAQQAGLNQRLATIDQQLAKNAIDIGEARSALAQQAGIPGSIPPEVPNDPWRYGPPEWVVGFGMTLSAALLLPVMIAWARRIWRRANVVSAVPPELVERMNAMERNLETVAIEIERIGEGQRFVTQLMASRGERAESPRLAASAAPGEAPKAP